MIRKAFLKVLCLFMLCVAGLSSCGGKREGSPKVLVFSQKNELYGALTDSGSVAIRRLGQQHGFAVDTTSNSRLFYENNLAQYAAVVFLNTPGEVLSHNQEVEFERYIQAGGGFVGIHAAADTAYTWSWYGRLVGARHEVDPLEEEATVQVVNDNHPATEDLPKQWKKTGTWFLFPNLSKEANVLLALGGDGKSSASRPLAWYQDFDGGRAFYTALGQDVASFQEPQFLKHLLGGIQYAIGDNKTLDYAKATSEKVPEEERFVKTMLAQGEFFEPTELAILPNLDILVTQRRGELMLYDQETKRLTQAGYLDVYHSTGIAGVNAEEGLMGIAADPDYARNNYIYLFYSPVDTSVNRLSRFVFRNNKLDKGSEKVILQFYSQRGICCHTGGSIAFGKDNMLYLSTGDNSTPFDEPQQRYVNRGYAPLDDRPGHEQFDARRSAGNTNDLRGKILRIRINPDGSYAIPDGNLFPKNEAKARPEIYVMGNRNPYRISVDQKTGFLYWGEVGPDAGVDSLDTRGPRGYDEINQARQAGYFGWPLFVGNNYAYKQYDYATGKTGAAFDPVRPVNNSRNNTGLTELPPVQPVFMWYPCGLSTEFPELGSGGRSAAAGPVYYNDLFPNGGAYPAYYNGKLFIYDWMRNWIKAVSMKENGDFAKVEPFMESTGFNSMMDMEVGPDGKLYVLEYGKGWFSKNPDAGLARIDYISGNLPPRVDHLYVDKTSGYLPLTITANVSASDLENDRLTYIWKIGNHHVESRTPSITYTLNRIGDHNVSVEVIDSKRAATRSIEIPVYAGNEVPTVDIALAGNRTFYFPGQPVQYKVSVAGKENIEPENLYVLSDLVEGTDLAGASMGHQVVSETMIGRSLMMASDCSSCHQLNDKSIGPSFTAVSQRYQKDAKAPAFLTQKIIKGGGGVWGETAMPAHPTMKEGEARQIVQWILSLTDTEGKKPSLPASGQLTPEVNPQKAQNTVLKLTATYTDNGGPRMRPLTGAHVLYLRSNKLDAGELQQTHGLAQKDSLGSKYLVFPLRSGWTRIPDVDLSGIGAIELTAIGSGQERSYTVEVKAGQPSGQKIGEGKFTFAASRQKNTLTVPLQHVTGEELQDVYVVITPAAGSGGRRPLLKTIEFVPAKGQLLGNK
jgi:glucose/arabinose dehydrogenase/cytochrome c551/c552